MNFEQCLKQADYILMEGALGERIKREYGLSLDENIAMAGLVKEEEGCRVLKELWSQYREIARKYNLPFLATTPTRRANKERVEKAKCDASIIYDNVSFLKEIQKESGISMYVGGLMGCKGDAYTGEGALSEDESFSFHSWQAQFFKEAKADFLYAGIMPTVAEAAGMAQAMAKTGLPYIISFTVQKDGKLIDGTTISDAISYIDSRVAKKPACYMTNCVHPSILYEALSQPFNQNHRVLNRFLGIQANTSPLSYAELDGSKDLKCSEPEAFARDMMKLREISKIKIFGGCCGTDNRHMEQVARRLSF